MSNNRDYNYEPNSINGTLSRMETKLDSVLEEQRLHRRDIDDLKKWRWYTTGIASAFSFIVALLTDSFRGK